MHSDIWTGLPFILHLWCTKLHTDTIAACPQLLLLPCFSNQVPTTSEWLRRSASVLAVISSREILLLVIHELVLVWYLYCHSCMLHGPNNSLPHLSSSLLELGPFTSPSHLPLVIFLFKIYRRSYHLWYDASSLFMEVVVSYINLLEAKRHSQEWW